MSDTDKPDSTPVLLFSSAQPHFLSLDHARLPSYTEEELARAEAEMEAARVEARYDRLPGLQNRAWLLNPDMAPGVLEECLVDIERSLQRTLLHVRNLVVRSAERVRSGQFDTRSTCFRYESHVSERGTTLVLSVDHDDGSGARLGVHRHPVQGESYAFIAYTRTLAPYIPDAIEEWIKEGRTEPLVGLAFVNGSVPAFYVGHREPDTWFTTREHFEWDIRYPLVRHLRVLEQE